MTLMELKEYIKNKNIPDDFIIFVCPENTFLASSYVNAICEAKQLEKTIVSSIFSQDSAVSLVMSFENNFKVLYTDSFEEVAEDYSRFTNTAVICSSVDKKLTKLLAPYIVEVPALLDWHVKAYIKQQCPALSDNDVVDLCQAAGGDIFCINNYLDKIKLFDASEQSMVAYSLARQPDAKPAELTNFAVADAIVLRDYETLKKYFLNASGEFMGLLSLLISKIRASLFVEYSTRPWQELGVSEKQYYRLLQNRLNYSQETLSNKLKVLTACELQLKSGLLDMSNRRQIDYLIMKLVT